MNAVSADATIPTRPFATANIVLLNCAEVPMIQPKPAINLLIRNVWLNSVMLAIQIADSNNLFVKVKRMQFIYNYEYMIYALVLIGIVLSVWIWTSILGDTPIPAGSIYDTSTAHGACKMRRTGSGKDLEKFYFFPKIGVLNTATALRNSLGETMSIQEMARKCKMFGQDCYGFDSDGNLVLERDKEALRFREFTNAGGAGYYRYLPNDVGGKEFRDICRKQFEGEPSGTICKLTDAQVEQLIRKLNAVKEKRN
jgi:hypothetical protein